MFKIVSSFTRKTTEYQMFPDAFAEHETVQQLHSNAASAPGYFGSVETLYQDEFRCDKAMCFDNEESFKLFVETNQQLLYKRKILIDEHCQRTGHEYKYYMISDKDKK
jgi:hypothetical protein